MDLIFLDLEMTGPNSNTDRIIEIGAIVCDDNLEIHATYEEQIYCPDNVLDSMDEWCTTTHTKTGLVDLVRAGSPRLAVVEDDFIDWLQNACGISPKQGRLAGYAIYTDRAFIHRWMPDLDDFLSYKMTDISSIRDCVKRWHPHLFAKIPKQDMPHRALMDCYVALEELKVYREWMKSLESEITK